MPALDLRKLTTTHGDDGSTKRQYGRLQYKVTPTATAAARSYQTQHPPRRRCPAKCEGLQGVHLWSGVHEPDEDVGDAIKAKETMVPCDMLMLHPSEWRNLPLTRMVGIPLVYAKWPAPNGGAQRNVLAQILAIDLDCSRSRLQLLHAGSGYCNFAPIRGPVVLVGEDGKALSRKHFEVLLGYVLYLFKSVIESFGETAFTDDGICPGKVKHKTIDDVAALQEGAKEAMKECPFPKAWKKYRDGEVAEGALDWKDLECPPLTQS